MLNTKANQSTTYTKTVMDSSLNLKSDKLTTYTKTDVDQKFNDLVNGAPALLNTLSEISASIANDPNYTTTTNSALNLKAEKNTTYTKTESDALLNAQANESTTHIS